MVRSRVRALYSALWPRHFTLCVHVDIQGFVVGVHFHITKIVFGQSRTELLLFSCCCYFDVCCWVLMLWEGTCCGLLLKFVFLLRCIVIGCCVLANGFFSLSVAAVSHQLKHKSRSTGGWRAQESLEVGWGFLESFCCARVRLWFLFCAASLLDAEAMDAKVFVCVYRCLLGSIERQDYAIELFNSYQYIQQIHASGCFCLSGPKTTSMADAVAVLSIRTDQTPPVQPVK